MKAISREVNKLMRLQIYLKLAIIDRGQQVIYNLGPRDFLTHERA